VPGSAAETGGEEVTRRLSTIVGLAFVALLATLAAQETTTIRTGSGGQWSGELTCWGSATGGGCGKWDQTLKCNGVIVNGGCTIDGRTATPIVITVGPTTLAAPGLKVYTTYLGLPCGPAFPMPGCLPPEMQGWLVQIEGGTDPHFDVTLVYTDATGRRHAHTQECVPRGAPHQGKPPFTAVPFITGRAKMPPWFPEGSTVVRTEAWPSKPGCEVRP